MIRLHFFTYLRKSLLLFSLWFIKHLIKFPYFFCISIYSIFQILNYLFHLFKLLFWIFWSLFLHKFYWGNLLSECYHLQNLLLLITLYIKFRYLHLLIIFADNFLQFRYFLHSLSLSFDKFFYLHKSASKCFIWLFIFIHLVYYWSV